MADYTRDNLRRVMANLHLTIEQVAEKSGLDKRTIMGILDGTNKPRAQTLHRLAEGLGVSPDEFFVDPVQLAYRHFDEDTNPVVQEVVDSHPDLFADWTGADFSELHSRFGSGGPLTTEGTLQAVRQMNRNRRLHEKLSLLLESSQAKVIGGILDLMYESVAVDD